MTEEAKVVDDDVPRAEFVVLPLCQHAAFDLELLDLSAQGTERLSELNTPRALLVPVPRLVGAALLAASLRSGALLVIRS